MQLKLHLQYEYIFLTKLISCTDVIHMYHLYNCNSAIQSTFEKKIQVTSQNLSNILLDIVLKVETYLPLFPFFPISTI